MTALRGKLTVRARPHSVAISPDNYATKGTHMRITLMLVVAVLSGCATNGYTKFYTPARGNETATSNPLYVKPPKVPALYTHSNDVDADVKRLNEDGYWLIGTSSFFGPSKMANKEDAIAQGQKVGAALVMLKTSYKDTLSGTMPMVLPNAPQTATMNTTGNVYGNGGSAYYNSTSTVTMPGGSTTYNIPYNVSRSDIFASYWVLFDPAKMRLGVRPGTLPDDVRNKLKRNTGAYVYIVVHGTPAFAANVMEGDVIVKIDDADVIDGNGFLAQLAQYQGQTVNLSIIRDGLPVNIRVPLKQIAATSN